MTSVPDIIAGWGGGRGSASAAQISRTNKEKTSVKVSDHRFKNGCVLPPSDTRVDPGSDAVSEQSRTFLHPPDVTALECHCEHAGLLRQQGEIRHTHTRESEPGKCYFIYCLWLYGGVYALFALYGFGGV